MMQVVETPRTLRPEQELMLAVLRQALDDYGRALVEKHARARRERYVLERWFFHDDLEWTFSFLNVCQGVGLDADALRRELRRWRAAGAPRLPRPIAGSGPFRLPNRGMRGTRTRVVSDALTG